MTTGNSEPSGLPPGIQVVESGSAGDPFVDPNLRGQGVTPIPEQAPTVPATPASQPVPSVPSGAVTDIAALLKNPELAKAIDGMVTERVSKAQSGWDKKNQALKTALDATRVEAKAAKAQADRLQREGQMANLPEPERAILLKRYEAEDLLADVEIKAKGVEDFYRSVEALNLVRTYSPFGFTEDDIDDEDTVEEMTIKALNKKADFLGAGGKLPAPAGTPAAASAASDVGAGGPATPTFKLGTAQSRNSMAANIRDLLSRPEKIL